MDIKIHDEIGGFWGGVCAREVLAQLATVSDGEQIDVSIHSPGGDMFDGLAIYNALKAHPSRVVVTVEGLAASAASLIAMAGDEIRMPENSYMMIHNPWGFVQGDAAAFAEAADLFGRFEETSANIYARRTGMPIEKVKEMQAATTWLDADAAKDFGLCDVVTDAVAIAAFARLPKAMVDCPVAFAQVEPEPSAPEPTVAPDEPAEPAEPAAVGPEGEAVAEPVLEVEPEGEGEPVTEPAAPAVDLMAVAAEIVELCQLAGQVARAAAWIREGLSAEEVRQQLAKLALENQAPTAASTAPDVEGQIAEAAKINMTVRSLMAAGKAEQALKFINNKKEN